MVKGISAIYIGYDYFVHVIKSPKPYQTYKIFSTHELWKCTADCMGAMGDQIMPMALSRSSINF